MHKLNLENKQKDYPLKYEQYLHNIFMASCNFALEELLFYHRSSPGVLHLRCDNGNLWQMELFWKVFPGCLFPDETHLFLLLSLLRRLRGKMVFSQLPLDVSERQNLLSENLIITNGELEQPGLAQAGPPFSVTEGDSPDLNTRSSCWTTSVHLGWSFLPTE